MRTTAAAGGDKGRDGELYRPEEVPDVAVQYSVAKDWNGKIRATVKRLAETMPDVTQLIYATNQVIGPAADSLISELRRGSGLSLDIRDRSWFVERELTAPQREIAGQELARRFVDPLLSARGVKQRQGSTLTGSDARVAVLHLTLETHDEASDKGLTKGTFESLTLAALHDTHAEDRLASDVIVERVKGYLPAGHDQQISALVAGSLGRLSGGKGGRVKHHKTTDDYCLSHAEVLALKERTAAFIAGEAAVESELLRAVKAAGAEARLALEPSDWDTVGRDLRRGVETVLLGRGEAFARAATSGEVDAPDVREVLAAVTKAGRSLANQLTDDEAAFAIVEVLDRPSGAVRGYLRRLADAYTLFAFLRQTPDVQKVVLTMFSEGDLWLDTSMVLPLIAETLVGDPNDRHYTILLRAARDAGLRLFVTDGVVEEIERHLNRCVSFARASTGEWRGRVPFVYTAYALSGRARSEFPAWAEEFRGRARPLDDLKDYLREEFSIEHRDLKEYSDPAPVELRAAVQEIWNEVHERRRARGTSDMDNATMARLVEHDVENSVGVMEARRQSMAAPLGHRVWWLTLDRTAYTLPRELKSRLGVEVPSPALSPDFLSQFLRLGPLRTAVERDLRVNLPLLTGISRLAFVPKHLIEEADRVRAETTATSDRIMQRRVRDTLDEMRAAVGPEAVAGLRLAQERVRESLVAQGS